MAFNRRNTMKVTYTVRDKDPKKVSYATFYIGELTGQLPNPNEAEFQAFIAEFAASLSNVVDTYVEGCSVSFDFFNDAAKTFGAAPDVERKGVFIFNTEDGFTSIFTMPGAKYSMFSDANGSDIIHSGSSFTGNPLATHLSSLHDKLVNGVTINLETYPITDRREKDLVSLNDAYKQTRSNPRG